MMMTSYTNVKVVKEDHNPDGSATLSVTALDADKKPATATVNCTKEGGSWKIGQENWHS